MCCTIPDVGGVDEGSFCSMRAISIRIPTYFFQAGRPGPSWLREIEHTFVTNSRFPRWWLLISPPQIGAINAAKKRLIGASSTNAVPRRCVPLAQSLDSERQVSRIIPPAARVMDRRSLVDGRRVGSERLHRVVVRLTREAEHCISTLRAPARRSMPPSLHLARHRRGGVPIYTFICVSWNP